MENFQGILERVWIALKDCSPGQELQGHNLNLTAKEKLSEEDVQAYKHWLIDHSLEDSFESLIEWVEIRVQIMEEAREETSGFGKRKSDGPEGRRNGFRGDRVRGRTFTTKSKSRGCIVDTCKQNHPPWVCKAFKELPVLKRKELIRNANRCYRCLAAGHHSKECPNAKRCGVDGCLSTNHSSYLHESTSHHLTDRSQGQLHVGASPFRPEEQPNPEPRTPQATGASTSDPAPVNLNPREQTHNTSHVSLMILAALISNGNKELRVNVMLDPCSTSSYVSEDAAEELELHGQELNLTIAGTGGTEVKTRSRRVELTVTNIDGKFSSPLQAHVLDSIAGDTPAIRWLELKDKWPHLRQVSFENVSRRRQIDIMIGSDHPVFHHVLKEACGDQPNDPVARLTNLGWVCFGPTLVEEFRRNTHSHFTRTNQSREFKPFVANRIGEIQRTSSPEQWRHVPGTVNPADLPTRGLSAMALAESEVCMEGPAFLKDDESTWPAAPPPRDNTMKTEDCERRTTSRTHVTKSHASMIIDPNKFSNLKRLVNVTGWVQRFLTNCRLPMNLRRKDRILLPTEISEAETFWIKQAQAQTFPGGENEGSLTQLSPKSDGDGLLRMDGRLRFADELPYDTRHPILLPKDHPVTRLVIVDAHERLGHGAGVEQVLTELRSRFWIVKGRHMVRSITEACAECRRRFTMKIVNQMMASLPKSRLQSSLRAFEEVGVDYGGPFLTKQGRGRTRAMRYLCLFTCLTTRAVHLEMSYSLDTDSFINAFTRMTSRRGTPTYVISDNGTNFVGAERELRELVEALDTDRITQETSKYHPIDWKFNPPCAPHFGGVFEALIKSAKKAIKAILGDADVTNEELHTAICGAERLLNSRPITYVSSDPNDLSPLTPSHFLVGEIGGPFSLKHLTTSKPTTPGNGGTVCSSF